MFLLLALVVFWLLVMRPARVQQKKTKQMQSQLTVGQEVVLSSGIFGTIRALGETRAEIEVAPGTVLTVARQVVVRRVEDLPEELPEERPSGAAQAEDHHDEPGPRGTGRAD